MLAADALHRALSGARGLGGAARRGPRRGRERVLVALSGGVDSAVAALLEREAGARRRRGHPQALGRPAHRRRAQLLLARGGARRAPPRPLARDPAPDPGPRARVPRRRRPARSSRATRRAARPNPCVLCNGELRLDAMIALADRVGAAALATGHYARLRDDGEGPLLAAAADEAKDQTYMLAGLRPASLRRLRFPLAELTKPEVRALAAERGLEVAGRAESQDLCFLAGQGKRAFLRRHAGLGERRGAIVDGGRRGGRRALRPSRVHRRAAARPPPRRRRAALRPRHRRRREHRHGRPARGAGDRRGARQRRQAAPRARPRRTGCGCATTRR